MARSGLLEQGNAEKTDSSAMRVCGPYGGAVCFIMFSIERMYIITSTKKGEKF